MLTAFTKYIGKEFSNYCIPYCEADLSGVCWTEMVLNGFSMSSEIVYSVLIVICFVKLFLLR